VDVTPGTGIDRARGPGLGLIAVDVDRDGWLDLFVANDTAQNHLWMNQRNGTFLEAALERGVAYSEDGQPKAGMGVAAGDYDNDGDEDLLVLNLRREGASLFRNDGKGFFTDASRASRIHAITLPFTGFGVQWTDYDNDGCLDVFLAHGAVTLAEASRGRESPYAEKSLLLRGSCGARAFEDMTASAGSVMNLSEIRRAAAFGDIDNDGRVDILVTNNNGPLRVLHNETAPGNWLSVTVPHPGARVAVYRRDDRPIWRTSRTDGSYLAANDPRLHFGLGAAAVIEKIVVEWADGDRQEERAPAISSRISIKKR
jgi:hypothetical protein